MPSIVPENIKEKWLRPTKINKQNNYTDFQSSVFHEMLIEKCWPDQQLPLIDLDVDLNTLSDDNVELNLYPILRILENQKLRNQNDDNLQESEKQEVIKGSKCIF